MATIDQVPDGAARTGQLPSLAGWWRRRGSRAVTLRAAGVATALALVAGSLHVLQFEGGLSLPVRVAGARARLVLPGVGAAGYPFAEARVPLALDPYGFVAGQCTSFAAWWLNAHGVPLAVITVGPDGPGSFLNASTWDRAAQAAGFRVGRVPVVGAVAQWHAGERSAHSTPVGGRREMAAGSSGHVAIVTAVLADGEAVWEEYGWHGAAQLHVGHGWAPRYLYLGVAPRSGGPR